MTCMGHRSALRRPETAAAAYLDTSREGAVPGDILTAGVRVPTLEQKVEFLSRSSTYVQPTIGVTRHETHMSWVFLAGDRVYKLKKPVRFPYLDFSNLRRREHQIDRIRRPA